MKVRRAYRMSARATAVEERGQRILAAARALFVDLPFEEITLDAVAARAGVTLQTVLRRFGSKSQLIAAAAKEAMAEVEAQRGQAAVGNAPVAVTNLFDHYEEWGDVSLRLLAQEERFEQIGEITRRARALHAAWVERVFGPELARRGESDRAVLRAQLIANCDVYLWKLLRRDLGLSRGQAERAVLGVIEALRAAGER
ncbi:MAG TPA: helix-turn-helix domain-containing protein [Myxococcaceae bacterium]|nr:helix-turn-helix domain-containing protein [Myxococcaceae bacterium]